MSHGLSCQPLTLAGALSGSLMLGVSALSAAGQSPPPPSPPPAVKVGEPAPDFTLPYLVSKPDGGFDTRQVHLADFKGKQSVVLAFFPAAFSPG